MWLLGNKTADEDIAEAHVRRKEGFEFFKLKIGVKPLAKEIAIALRGAARRCRTRRSAPTPIAG